MGMMRTGMKLRTAISVAQQDQEKTLNDFQELKGTLNTLLDVVANLQERYSCQRGLHLEFAHARKRIRKATALFEYQLKYDKAFSRKIFNNVINTFIHDIELDIERQKQLDANDRDTTEAEFDVQVKMVVLFLDQLKHYADHVLMAHTNANGAEDMQRMLDEFGPDLSKGNATRLYDTLERAQTYRDLKVTGGIFQELFGTKGNIVKNDLYKYVPHVRNLIATHKISTAMGAKAMDWSKQMKSGKSSKVFKETTWSLVEMITNFVKEDMVPIPLMKSFTEKMDEMEKEHHEQLKS